MAAPNVDFGKAAASYAAHRQGFPPDFHERLERLGIDFAGRSALDLGTGTGLLARAMAARGAEVTGLDPSLPLLEQARATSGTGKPVRYIEGSAEQTGLNDASFDIVSAATCWHWLDRAAAAHEAARLLKPDGTLIICHLDWRRGPSGIIELTSRISAAFNPAAGKATGANTFQHPAWLADLWRAGLGRIEVFGYETALSYSRESWVERAKASASIGPALPQDEVERFGDVLKLELKALHPAEPMAVEHYVFCVIARRDPPAPNVAAQTGDLPQ